MKLQVPYVCMLMCIVLIKFYAINGEEECMPKNPIKCYDCTSRNLSHCRDPFNYTDQPESLPFISDCNGCCVKIVRFQNTPREIVERTCTKNMKISLFMVDHVCMKESNGHGHMCFCEENHCNGSNRIFLDVSHTWSYSLVLLLSFILLV